ncbi:putative mediator of RNA polymerase II transcription subunit 26 [Oppia nitens]|uniref:putative mediator of RNA polymerase II transcription subunit 26 n=1 Tax=Oppia nitens TaxID=1686743 RepID=UPI0023DBD9FC|nr:putative mediator of RNA polymerase II transcription subunit 26 [Oppia nitens]
MFKLIIVALLVSVCLATTPLQQPIPQPQEGRQFRDEIRNSDGLVYGKYGYQDPSGGLRIVKYTAGKDGLTSQVDNNVPIVGPQPVVWNPNEPIYVEPAPLTYTPIRNEPFLTERDQQRYLNIDDALVEAREEVNEDVKPVVNDAKVEVEPKDDSDSKLVDNQKQVVNEPTVLFSSAALKGVQDDAQDVFPQVVSGQRRLVEPQLVAQQYAIKGRPLLRSVVGYGQQVVPKQHSVYHTVQQQQQQQGLPIHIEEQRVSPLGVRKPTIQYQIRPVQQQVIQRQPVFQQQQQTQQRLQPALPREWIRKPVQQQQQVQTPLSGVKGIKNYQYFIQPFYPSNIDYNQQSVLSGVDQQVVQRQPVVDQQQFVQQIPQVFSLTEQQQQQPFIINQRHDAAVDNKLIDHSGHVGHDQHIQQHHHQQQQQTVHELPKSDVITQKHVRQSVVPQLHDIKVVIQQQQQPQQVGTTGGQQIVTYQIPQQQQQQQQQYYISQQQPTQYSPQQQSIPVSNIQQYYQVVSGSSVPQYLSIVGQNPSINGQNPTIVSQPFQYSVDAPVQQSTPQQVGQQVPSVTSLTADQEVHVQGGLQGVQNIRVPEDLSVFINRGQPQQDIRINPLSVDQKVQQQQRPSLLINNSGVKSVINV